LVLRSLRSEPLGSPANARRSPRQEQILDALEALVRREGFGALTVGELAARLRCSRSTLYALAPSKEQLFLIVEARFLERIQSAARAAADKHSDPTGRLQGYMEGALEVIRDIETLFLAEIQAHPPARRLVDEFQRTTIEDLCTLLEEGIAAGVFQAVNVRLAAELLDAAAGRIQDPRVLGEAGLTAGQALADMIQVITRGLLTPPH
jgi:AcrR family transcriptional regulator